MGHAPQWYKNTILILLIVIPVVYFSFNAIGLNGGFYSGWILLLGFIFTLAMALKCYPLQPGGLLALEAVLIGLTDPDSIWAEIEINLPVIFLVIFMVSSIYFLKDLLRFIFNEILIVVHNKIAISISFLVTAAVLSAFLDALTVIAVIITACIGFVELFEKIDKRIKHVQAKVPKEDLKQFRAFLRDIVMHAAVGTALGGASTIVGEPQNLLIAYKLDWSFLEFMYKVAYASAPIFAVGVISCFVIEKFKLFKFGATMPQSVRDSLAASQQKYKQDLTVRDKTKLLIQFIGLVLLVIALGLHIAEVALIGIALLIFVTTFNGITTEHEIGKAFEESLPFATLLVVFFMIVAVIHSQHLFSPITDLVLAAEDSRSVVLYFATAILSVVSDNVFVATIYINEMEAAFKEGILSAQEYENSAVAINIGTNIPSIGTPNGQAAFLFLLTSSLAPAIRLSYMQMVLKALPYTIVLTIVGWICISTFY